MAKSDPFEARTAADAPPSDAPSSGAPADGASAADRLLVDLARPVAEGMFVLQSANVAGLAMLAAQQSQQQAAITASAAACMTCATLLAIGSTSPKPEAPAAVMSEPDAADARRSMEEAPLASPEGGTRRDGAAIGLREMIAQAAGLAVQDAVIALRNAAMIANTASGASIAHYLRTGDAGYLDAAARARAMMRAAIADFEDVGAAAARIAGDDREG